MSMLETIYATLLLGFIALFLLNLYPSSFLAIKRGESTFTADNFASNILEDLHSRSFANLIPGSEPAYSTYTSGGIDYVPMLKIFYLPAPAGSLPDPGADPRYLKVAQVTVSWKYSSVSRSVSHEAYLHNVTR